MLLKTGTRVRYAPRLDERLDGTIREVNQNQEKPYMVNWDSYPVSWHPKSEVVALDDPSLLRGEL